MKPIEKKFDELAQVMEKHYFGQKNPRSERYKCKTIVRTEKESIQNFAVRLREAARYRRFGADLDENLVDQFLAGVNLKECVKKIVENSEGLELTFQKAVDIALEVEEREKNSSSFVHEPGAHSVAQIHHEAKANLPAKRCFRCYSQSHFADKCKHKECICHGCSKKGHLKVACVKTKFSKERKQNNYPRESKGFKGQHEVSIKKRDEKHVTPQQVDPDEFGEYSSNIWTVAQLSFELNVNNATLTESDRKVTVPFIDCEWKNCYC